MKLKTGLFIALILSSLQIYSQQFRIQQITSIPGADCKNFSTPEPFNDEGYFIFEADFGNKTSIWLGKYDSIADTFYIIKNLTNNEFRNTNPSFTKDKNGKLVFVYQTNEKGNWDIAYRVFIDDTTVSAPIFLTKTLTDETNPRVRPIDYNSPASVAYTISYLSGPGAGFALFDTTKPPAVIFYPFGDNHYTLPTLVPVQSFNYNDINYVASVDSSDFHKYIVYREYRDGIWGVKKIFKLDTASNLNVNTPDYYGYKLTYDAKNPVTHKWTIYSVPRDFDTAVVEIRPGLNYDIGDFHSIQSLIVTNDKYPFSNIFGYKAYKNDSLFIAVPKENEVRYSTGDTLVYTKVKNTSLNVGRLGFQNPGDIMFTVWQDSINGRKLLVGKKTIKIISAVNDPAPKMNFTLNQNYPNPFNPSTKISWHLSAGAIVKLTIYNSIGEIVSVPVNEYRQSGSQEINFTPHNLTSGIYFYELTCGTTRTVKKMTYLK